MRRSSLLNLKGEGVAMCRGGVTSTRWVLGVLAAVCMIALSAVPASAHQNPAGCTGNNIGLDLLKDKTTLRNGESVHYIVKVRNDAAGACDIDNATVTFHCPAANGTPTGALSTFVTGAAFPAGFPLTTIGETDCVITVTPPTTIAQASSEVHGTLHDNPLSDIDTADVAKFVSVLVEYCGDGVVNGPELCDDGNTNNFDACRNDCTLPFCGDGIVDAGESCDDGIQIEPVD